MKYNLNGIKRGAKLRSEIYPCCRNMKLKSHIEDIEYEIDALKRYYESKGFSIKDFDIKYQHGILSSPSIKFKIEFDLTKIIEHDIVLRNALKKTVGEYIDEYCEETLPYWSRYKNEIEFFNQASDDYDTYSRDEDDAFKAKQLEFVSKNMMKADKIVEQKLLEYADIIEDEIYEKFELRESTVF